jgi:phage baseplate assembly protein W
MATHLAQSCEDIVTTPLGTRVMRRDYGCLLAELIDRPLNRATLLLASMAIALALARWEPRITVRQVTVSGDLARPAIRNHRHPRGHHGHRPHPPDHPPHPPLAA